MAGAVFQVHLQVGAAHLATGLLSGVDGVARDGQPCKFASKNVQGKARINQRAQQHIAAGPADRLDVGDTHTLPAGGFSSRQLQLVVEAAGTQGSEVQRHPQVAYLLQRGDDFLAVPEGDFHVGL